MEALGAARSGEEEPAMSSPDPHTLNCPECGEPTEELHEGYCADCCADRQAALDTHNRSYDEWMQLSDGQRAARIRTAMRLEP